MGCRRGLFVSILFTFLVAAHSAFAADSHVQGPANLESDQIQIEKQFPLDVWPEGNTDPCPEFLDGAFQLVENIASECGERFYSKGSDYSIIAAHGVAVCFIPELLPAFIHEIKEEGKKDLLYCVLAGVAETTDWPAEEKAAWKAGLNAILEVRDSMGDVTAVPEAQKYLEKNPLAKLNTPNADDLIDRFKQQWKEWEKHHSSVLEAFTKGKEVVGNPALFAGWNVYGAGQTLEVLLAGFQGKESVFDERAEAVRELKKTCDDQLTLTAITYALTAGQDWLQSVRLARRASAKSLMCTEKEYAKIEKIGNRSGGVYREFTASVQREKEDLKSKISGFERQDQEIQSKMRALMKDYLDVKSTQAQLELDKAAVRTRLESAEGMAAKCDFKQAHQELQDIYKKMVNPCGQPIAKLDQIAATKRIGELESQLHSDERKIQYFFNESTKAILCSELESAIRSIEGLRDQNQCVGRESATKKVADLQKLISDSTKAENDLQNRLIEATSFLDKCDVTAATTAIAKAQEARERIKCRDRLHEESEFTALVGKGETVKAATKKLLEETAKILEHAERARENCDDARLQADSEQLVQLIQEFSSICKSTPAAADKAKARIRTLLTMGTDKDMPKQVAALVAHATAALKKCDQLAVGMDAAALELIGKDCGYDGIAEAKKLRSASEGLTKAEDSLSQNVAAIRSKMEGLVSEACNDNEAKQLHQEASRLVDQHTKSCTSVPSSVSTDLGLIENLHQSIPAEINKRLKFAASAKGEALSVVKSCDLVAIMEAADELQKVPCLDDAENRAEALRQAGKQIAKSHESLMANIDALHGKARAADAACDSEGVKSIYFEAGRLADAFSAKCPKFSPETGATLAAIQGIAESSEQRVAGEKEIVALFHQVEVAWKACRFSEANTLIEQMD